MGRFSEKQLLIATLAAIALVLIGGGVWMYFLNGTHGEVQAEIAKLDAEVNDRKKKRTQNDEMQQTFDSETFKKEQEALNQQLPVEAPTGDTDFIVSLNNVRRSYPSIVFKRVEGVPDTSAGDSFKPPAGVRRMIYRVDMKGRFYDVLEYLSQLENADRIYRVEHFSLKRKASTASGPEALAEAVEVEAVVRLMSFEFESKGGAAPAR